MANENIDSLNSEIDKLMAEAVSEKEEIEKGDTNDESTDADDNTSEEYSESEEPDDEEQGQEEKSEDNANADESEEQSADDVKVFEPVKVKVDGQEITLDNAEEVASYLTKVNSEKQLNKESINDTIVNQAKLSQDELRLLADIKAGKPGALKKLAELSKIDLADADEFEGNYETEFNPVVKSDVDVVLDNIKSNKELSAKFGSVVNDLPDDFLNAIGSDATSLQQFAGHIDSGIAQELLPLAAKAMATKGGTLLDNYIAIGNEKFSKQNSENKTQDKKATTQKRETSGLEDKLRKRASADTDSNKSGATSELTVDDLWSDGTLDKIRNGEINLRDLA